MSEFVFRTDICAGSGTPDAIVSAIADYAREPSYLGYPYPLATIHNRVIVQKSDADAVRAELEYAALEKGIQMADWGMLFANFHDVLDRGV